MTSYALTFQLELNKEPCTQGFHSEGDQAAYLQYEKANTKSTFARYAAAMDKDERARAAIELGKARFALYKKWTKIKSPAEPMQVA